MPRIYKMSLKLLLLLSFFTIIAVPLVVSGQHTIITSIPGTEIRSGQEANITLQEYIRQIYVFALGIVGLIALVAIVYWAFMYILGAGNPSKMSDAMSGIQDAILGLVILLLAALILGLINPNLVTLKPFSYFDDIPGASQPPVQFVDFPTWIQKCSQAGCLVNSCEDAGKITVTDRSQCEEHKPEPSPIGDNNLCCINVPN